MARQRGLPSNDLNDIRFIIRLDHEENALTAPSIFNKASHFHRLSKLISLNFQHETSERHKHQKTLSTNV